VIAFAALLAGVGLGFVIGLVVQSERQAAHDAPVAVIRSLPRDVSVPTARRRGWSL
jgi:hypothetical protein